MKKDIMKLVKGMILAALITLSAGSAFAWTPAPSLPAFPGNNTPEPINVSDDVQGKGITPNTYSGSLLNIKGTFSAEKMLVLFDAIINGQLTVGSLSQANNSSLQWAGGKEPVCATTNGTLVLCGVPVTAPSFNLIAQNITSSPSTVTVGVPVTFSAEIKNNGLSMVPAGQNFTNSFQIPFSPLLYASAPRPIPIGGIVTITSPSYTFSAPGTYSVKVCADNNDTVTGESDESLADNCTTVSVTVTALPTMTGFTGAQSCTTGTDTINLSWNAVQGAGGYFLARRSSTNGVWDGPWVLPYQTIAAPTTTFTDTNLVAGKAYSYRLRWYQPGSTQSSGEWANTVGPLAVPSCFIDLTAGAVTAIPSTGTNIVFGVPINLRSPITNVGTISTTNTIPTYSPLGSFYNKFQLADGWHGPNGDQGGGINPSTIQNLVGYATAPGTSPAELGALNGNNGSAPVYAQKTFTNNGVFNYSVRACADTNTNVNNPVVRVTESNESNNCSPWSSLAIQYTPPILPDMKIVANSFQLSSNNIPITSSLTTTHVIINDSSVSSGPNNSRGHIAWSTDPSFPSTQPLTTASESDGTSHVYTGGQTRTFQHTIGFPTTGTYYVRACADQSSNGVGGLVAESDENNNCSPAQTVVVTGPLLTVTKAGTASSVGTVTSNPQGIYCGTICTSTSFTGSVVLTAAANGSTFAGWSGTGTVGNPNCLSGSTGTCTLTMNAARSVTATFNATVGAPHGSVVYEKSFNSPQTYTILSGSCPGCTATTFHVPTGVNSITAKAWGYGGNGQNGSNSTGGYSNTGDGGRGGGGGGYSEKTISTSPGIDFKPIVGYNGSQSSSVVKNSTQTITYVSASGGQSGANGGAGGTGSLGTINISGNQGLLSTIGVNHGGNGGDGAGANGTGGSGGVMGDACPGGQDGTAGSPGSISGGGGGGSGALSCFLGGAHTGGSGGLGGAAKIVITW